MEKLHTYQVKMKILATGKIVELGSQHEVRSDTDAIGIFAIYIKNNWQSPLDAKEATFTLVKDGNEIIATLPTQNESNNN